MRFDYLAPVLHEAASSTMRLHVLETCESDSIKIVLPVADDLVGLVWRIQWPLVASSVAEVRRWPWLLERVERYGVPSC